MRRFWALLFVAFLPLWYSCKKDETNDVIWQDEIRSWDFDVDEGYRFFVGVCEYKNGMSFPELYLYVHQDEQELSPMPGIRRNDSVASGIIISNKLFYYYDISETFSGKKVSLVFNSDDIRVDNIVSLDLGDDRNIWLMIEDAEINVISALMSRDRP